MNDFQGLPGSPPNAEAEQTRSIFQRAADAIVGISALATVVEEMKNELQALKNDLDYTRQRNKELDEMVSEVRRQRDEAFAERDRNAQAGRRVEVLEGDITYLNQQLTQVRQERDDLGFKHLEITEKFDALNVKWEKVQALLCPEPAPVNPPAYAPEPQRSQW